MRFLSYKERRHFLAAAVAFVGFAGVASASQLDASFAKFDNANGSYHTDHNTKTSTTDSSISFTAKAGPYSNMNVSVSYGSASVSGGLGISKYSYFDEEYSSAGGNVAWTDTYVIMPSDPSLMGHAGIMHATFHLDGNIHTSVFPLPWGYDEGSVQIDDNTVAQVGYDAYSQGYYDTNLGDFSTMTYDRAFVFGQPFDLSARLTSSMVAANYNGFYNGATYSQSMTLSAGGFTVSDNNGNAVNFSSTSNMGSSAGGHISGGQTYVFSLNDSVAGTHGTALNILDGTASGDASLHANFLAADAQGNLVPASDIVDFGGTHGDQFVIQLSYDPAAVSGDPSDLILAWKNPATGLWTNAVDGNSHGTPTQIIGAYDPNQDFVLGDYGVDTANHTVWAVIDHNSMFAAGTVAVPEPTSIAMIAGAVGAMTLRRRRCR